MRLWSTNMVQASRDVGGAPLVGGHHAMGQPGLLSVPEGAKSLAALDKAGFDVCRWGSGMKKGLPQGLTVGVRVHADDSVLQFQGWRCRSPPASGSKRHVRRSGGSWRWRGQARLEDPSPRPAAALLLETREVQPPGTSQQEPSHMGDAKKSYCKISFFFFLI